MKKTTTKTIHTFFLILIITSITFISNSKKANALLDPFSGPIFGIEISEKARKTISDIKDYINQAQQVVNTYKSSKALIKQVTNADLSNFAMNNSASQILNFGDTSLQVLSGDQGVGINVNTDGSQVVTNLGKYLDKIGVNEIRKGLNDLEDVSNLTPFTADIQKQIVDFSRNIGDTKTGKLINFTLPYIVRSEICNDPNLKNIIKNGEPADYVNAKKAVANVDIDKACQTPNLLSPKDQAVFVSLAKTGYGGAETKQALADPNNTPSAITGNAISKIIGLKNESEDTASKETTATDLVIGQKTCYDKDGKLVSFDPASIDTSHMLCYDTETSVEQSPTVVKNRTAAALLSPYISMLSRAMATTENACGSIGSSGPTYSTGVDTGKPENTTINPDLYNQPIKTPTNMPSYNPKPSGYNNQSMLRKIFSLIFTKASAQSETLGDINDIISGVNKGIDCTSQAFNSASGVMNSIVGVLNIGAKNVTQILNKEDNPYSRLAKNFESIITAQKNQKNLYTAADQAQKDYENGATGYTVDDLKQAVSTYQNIREIDVNKLNNMVFTYAFVNLAIANSKSAIPPGKHCTLGCKNKTAAANRAIANVKDSVTGLQQAAISLNNAINDLIKELAKNNYKEQQINKLYNQFLTTDTRAEDNQDTLKNLLGDAYTATDYANISMD